MISPKSSCSSTIVPISSSDEGNTNLHRSKQVSPAKHWCFTWNNYDDSSISSIVSICEQKQIKYCIGKEVAPTTGTPHLQGFITGEKKFRPSSLNLPKGIHWEACKGSIEQNYQYCTKCADFTTNIKLPKPLKVLTLDQLYPWQRRLYDICKQEPDDRTIYWVWEHTGNVGKTAFSKFLSHKMGAVPLEGKKNDILYCAATFESDIYIYDLERSMEEFVSYASIEKIKNGYFMVAKYESKPIIRNPPHVFIFANFPPDMSKLSLDRWNIIDLNDYDPHIAADDITF